GDLLPPGRVPGLGDGLVPGRDEPRLVTVGQPQPRRSRGGRPDAEGLPPLPNSILSDAPPVGHGLSGLPADGARQAGVDDAGVAAGGLADGPGDGAVADADDLDFAPNQAADEGADADPRHAVLAQQAEAVGVEHGEPVGGGRVSGPPPAAQRAMAVPE